MNVRLLLLVALLGLGLSIAHSVRSAQAAIRPFTSSGECQLRGMSVFRPPLSLKNQETKVTFTGTLSACPKDSYGITGGTIKTFGSGLATCSSDYSDTQTSTGAITWKGAKGTSSYTSTSTAIGNSNPPATWVSGTMTGGSPLPKGTSSEGETSFKITKSMEKACKAGTLRQVSVSGTTAPTLAACTLTGTTSFDPPLGLTNQETTVTFDGAIERVREELRQHNRRNCDGDGTGARQLQSECNRHRQVKRKHCLGWKSWNEHFQINYDVSCEQRPYRRSSDRKHYRRSSPAHWDSNWWGAISSNVRQARHRVYRGSPPEHHY